MAAGYRDSLIGGEDAGPNFGSGFDFIAKAGIKISQTAHGTAMSMMKSVLSVALLLISNFVVKKVRGNSIF